MRIRILLLALLVMLPLSANAQLVAQNAWVICGTNDTSSAVGWPAGNVVDSDTARICYSFDESVVATYVAFSIATPTASCSLLDDAGAPTGSAVVQVRLCPPTGVTTKDADTCSILADTFTSNDAGVFSRGDYAFVVTVDPTAGDDALFSCAGQF